MPDSQEITRPYPGLRPFESWEGEIFFGREEHTNRLLDILKERHFLAVIGPSGSGKSSLVRAGLLPTLPLGSLGTGSDWRIALMRPGNRPIRSLAHALLARSTLGAELVGEERIQLNKSDLTPEAALIEADLRRGPLGLIDIVQDARARHTGKDGFNLLILVDQFEELFTYAEAGGHQADEAEAFVNLLLAPQTVADAQIYIVLTMRTDFLGDCVRFLELPDAINRSQYLTPRLTREQIERAITSPAYLFNGDVEVTLVTELINSVSNDPDQLPILQHALSRMWDEAKQRQNDSPCIAWRDFNTVGGITNSLSLHADEILASLSPLNRIERILCPEQMAAVDLFRAITEQRSAEAGGQAVRRPQSLARIAKWTGRKWQEFKPAISAYSKEGTNFLHINSTLNKDTIVDISHEALIRQWQRLRQWVSQEARLASEYQRLRSRTEDFINGSGALLTGADLARALEWRNGAFSIVANDEIWRPNSNWADRYRKNENSPSSTEFDEVMTFIDDSHAVVLTEKRRSRIIKRTLIVLTALSMVTTIGAFGFAFQSHTNQIKTEAALLWTSFDFSSPSNNFTDKQSSGLLKLERANDAQKRVFVDQLMKDQTLAERFINNPEVIMTALAGISPTRKNKILQRMNETPQKDSDIFRLTRFIILSELEAKISDSDILSAFAIKSNKDLMARKILGQRLKRLIDKMPVTELVELSNRILATFNDPHTFYEFEPRADALSAIIDRVPQDKLDNLAEQLIVAVKTTTNPRSLDTLRQSLARVAATMKDAQQSGVLANRVLAAINASSIPAQIEALEKALEILATRVPENMAEDLAQQIALQIKNTKNAYPFMTLGQSLANAAAKMPGQNTGTGLLARQLFADMKDTTIPEQFDDLGQGLAAIADKIPAADIEPLTIHLIDAIKDPRVFKIIGQGLQENDLYRFRTIGKCLAAMIKMIPAERSEYLAELFFSGLNQKQLDPGQFEALGLGLAEATAKMTQNQADSFAGKVTAVMINTKVSYRQFNAFGQGMTGVAKQLSAPKAEELAQHFIAYITTQKRVQSFNRFDVLGMILAELAAKVSKDQAGKLTEQLSTAMRSSENRMQTTAFGLGMEKAAATIPVPQIGAVAAQIMSLLKDSNDTQFKFFVRALAAMVRNFPENHALVAANSLTATLTELSNTPNDEQSRNKIKSTGKGLKAVGALVKETQVEELTDRLIAEIKASSDPDKNEALGMGLGSVCTKTPLPIYIAQADKLITAMKLAISSSQFEAIGECLSALIGKLPEPRLTLAKQLVEIILQTQNPSQLHVLGQVLAVIMGEQKPDDHTLARWFDLLKNPLTPRNIMTTAIRQRLSDVPKEHQGVWELIEWAEQCYPFIDLEAPLKEPVIL